MTTIKEFIIFKNILFYLQVVAMPLRYTSPIQKRRHVDNSRVYIVINCECECLCVCAVRASCTKVLEYIESIAQIQTRSKCKEEEEHQNTMREA